MSFITKIEAFIFGPVWAFVKPFITIIESEGGQLLIAAAENAVLAGATAITGGGAAAMSAALASFEAEVVAKGLPFIESQARALIEVALQRAKTAVAVAA